MKSCCLIVTYNRKELLCRCIEHCLDQEIKPDIMVFDNASIDGTSEYLEEHGYLNNPRIFYYLSNENLGGAGGFSKGLQMAFEKGYDFIWMMDDDGYPKKRTSLQECIKVYKKNNGKVIVNAIVYAEQNMLSFRISGCDSLDDIERKFGNSDIIYDAAAPFNGTLVGRNIIKRIGYPRADFFIKGDEIEYMCRAKACGFRLATARNADFYHPRIEKKKFLFRQTTLSEEAAWKEYCRARNYMYIYRTYFGKKALFKHYIVSTIMCMLYKDDRKRKISAVRNGLRDGKKGIFKNSNVMKYRD